MKTNLFPFRRRAPLPRLHPFFALLCCACLATAARAAVVINEIQFRAYMAEYREYFDREYVELYNAADEPVDVSGWRFTDGVEAHFPDGTSIPAGGYLVVGGADLTLDASIRRVEMQGKLSNGGERLRLVDADGEVVDEVDYSTHGGEWASLVLTENTRFPGETRWDNEYPASGASLQRLSPHGPSNRGHNWRIAMGSGTPGEANRHSSSNAVPLLWAPRHSPALPTPDDRVTVTINVEDVDGGIESVEMTYRVYSGGTGAVTVPMSPLPDNPNRYAATIPPQPAGRVVEVDFVAKDAAGQVSTYPRYSGGDIFNQFPGVFGILYSVFSESAAEKIAGGELQPGDVPRYHITMLPVDLADLRRIFGGSSSNATFPATFIARTPSGIDVRYLCLVRNRGSSSRRGPPNNFRVELPNDDKWRGRDTFFLNCRNPFSQIMGAEVFNEAGVPAQRASAVKLYVNGSLETAGDQFEGLFADVHPLNEEFVEYHFPSDADGNLYKISDERGPGDLRPQIQGAASYRQSYLKETNEAEDDFSDLIALIDALNPSWGGNDFEAVDYHADLRQWATFFAADSLMCNVEGGLPTGRGDDYALYFGDSTRAQLIPRDLDSVLGQNVNSGNRGLTWNSYQYYSRVWGIEEVLATDWFKRWYVEELLRLANGPLAPARVQRLIDERVGHLWPEKAQEMIEFYPQRVEWLLSQYSLGFSIDSGSFDGYELVDGIRVVPDSEESLLISGNYNEAITTYVSVNERPATSSEGAWSLGLSRSSSGSKKLVPGFMKLVIEERTNKVLSSESVTIYVQPTIPAIQVSGTLDDALIGSGLMWSPEGGPYRLSGEVIVPEGGRLKIEAGTTVLMEPESKLKVRGTLIVDGTEYRPVFFQPTLELPDEEDIRPGLPHSRPKWDGIQFVGSVSADNRVSHAIIGHAQSSDGSIGVHDSQAVIEHCTFSGTHLRMIYTDNSSVIIQNCVFPDMFGPDEDPIALGLDNISEQITGLGGIPDGGHYIIRNNVFGGNKGHNDIIDINSNMRPAPILQVIGNRFSGVGDEHLDLSGDVYMEGNYFENVFKDDSTSDRGYANVVSNGDLFSGGTVVAARNVFVEVDHAVNLKNSYDTIFEHNTVYRVHDDFEDRFGHSNVGSVINLYVDEFGATAGAGGYAAGNIFHEVPRIFGNIDQPGLQVTALHSERNFLDSELAAMEVGERGVATVDFGEGHVVGDPLFANPEEGDFSLMPGSPAAGMGMMGRDMGAGVPGGVWISGVPRARTGENSATLLVGGPGIVAYKWRLNGGAWSEALPLADEFSQRSNGFTASIALEDLPGGTYQIEVLGQNYAGDWQETPTVSAEWMSTPNLERVEISEVMALNEGAYEVDGAFPDYVELANSGAVAVDLGGMTLSDDPDEPAKFTFAPETVLEPGAFLVLLAEDAPVGDTGAAQYLGFSIKAAGEGVYLYDSAEEGGEVVDSVEFGNQLANHSLGRAGQEMDWCLNLPTPGAQNVAVAMGDPLQVRLNEWLASADDARGDFVELYNPQAAPVNLAGFSLSDNRNDADRFRLPEFAFVGAEGAVAFFSDAEPELDFGLDVFGEDLTFFDPEGTELDRVFTAYQYAGVSASRDPETSRVVFNEFPSPGLVGSEAGIEELLVEGLRISELHYHPEEGGAEFVELINIGEAAISLAGVRFADGIEFTFGDIALAAGERIVLARDATAFAARYGAEVALVGTYAGALSNGGESIRLETARGTQILEFEFEDFWHGTSDGGGHSLSAIADLSSSAALGLPASWAPSLYQGGSPGSENRAIVLKLTSGAIITELSRTLTADIHTYGMSEEGFQYAWSAVGTDAVVFTSSTTARDATANLPHDGVFQFEFVLTGPGFDLTDTLDVSVGGESFYAWRSEQFTGLEWGDSSISGADADPDRDGRANLLEFALGLSPKDPADANLPEPVALDEHLALEYRVVVGPGFTVIPEVSSSATGPWFSGPNHVEVELMGGGNPARYRAVDRTSITEAATRYIRLRVQLDQ